MAKHILLVEDVETNAALYMSWLKKAGFHVRHAATIARALESFNQQVPDLVIADYELPDGDAAQLIKTFKQQQPALAIIVITAHGSVERAVAAMQLGAADFIQKPFTAERLLATVTVVAENAQLKASAARQGRAGFNGFIGTSAAMQSVYQTIEQVAGSRVPVFITGETGVGKEVAARALHAASPRHAAPFKAINCAAIPENLLESELFGHVKGAFSGAVADRQGLLQSAHGGTVLLDELAEMPMALQPKLLRVIQTGMVQPVGSDKEVAVDVRYVAATNRNPWQAVADGQLREDLFFRLHVVPLELPPLRMRREDIKPLVEFFVQKYAAEEGKQISAITEDVWQELISYDWPGNVRQLENTVRYAVALCTSGELVRKNLPSRLPGMPQAGDNGAVPQLAAGGEPQSLAAIERAAIENALAKTNNDVAAAAALLNVAPSTIYRKKQAWDAG